MKIICLQQIGEGVLLEHVYVVRARNRSKTCEAGSLITMAFMKNVPDRHVKVRTCCHKLCIYFQPTPTCSFSSIRPFFLCDTVNILSDCPTFSTICAIVIVNVKTVHCLMERSQAYVDMCACLRASDHIYILFLGTLLNFMPSSHVLLCSRLSVSMTSVTLLPFLQLTRKSRSSDLTSNKNTDWHWLQIKLESALFIFCICRIVIMSPVWPVSWLGLCPQLYLSLLMLYYGTCGYVSDMFHWTG